MIKTVKKILCVFTVLSFLLAQGCTNWKDSGAFFRTEQTKLTVESRPPGNVFVNNKLIGKSPLTTPLEYEQKVNKSTREVNYWVTQPGWSLFFTLISIGLYLPFSLIPIDTETTLTPTGTYNNNQFNIRVEADNNKNWEKQLLCNGQPFPSIRAKKLKSKVC